MNFEENETPSGLFLQFYFATNRAARLSAVGGASDMQRPSSGWFLDLNGVCSDPWGPSVEVPSHPAVTTKACQLKMQGSRQEMATPSAFWPPGECQTCKGLHPVGSWT